MRRIEITYNGVMISSQSNLSYYRNHDFRQRLDFLDKMTDTRKIYSFVIYTHPLFFGAEKLTMI
jgi:hypothetical protein